MSNRVREWRWIVATGIGWTVTLAYSVYYVGSLVSPWPFSNGLNIAGALAGLSTLCAFLYHARYKSGFSEPETKAWVATLYLGSIVVFPYYWYRFIVKDSTHSP